MKIHFFFEILFSYAHVTDFKFTVLELHCQLQLKISNIE